MPTVPSLLPGTNWKPLLLPTNISDPQKPNSALGGLQVKLGLTLNGPLTSAHVTHCPKGSHREYTLKLTVESESMNLEVYVNRYKIKF